MHGGVQVEINLYSAIALFAVNAMQIDTNHKPNFIMPNINIRWKIFHLMRYYYRKAEIADVLISSSM